MSVERLPGHAEEHQQTDSPASTRPGFRMSCQMAASKSWDFFRTDFETYFLQKQSYHVTPDVVCQLPPETGHPPHIAARLQKPACGMNDASRRWWNIFDKALCSYGMVPTRADRLCCLLSSTQSRERAWEPWRQKTIAQSHGTGNVLTESRERSKNGCFEKMLDPIAGSYSFRKNSLYKRSSNCIAH